MKKKYFFLPIVAALALTGCSNEDVPVPGPESVPGSDGDGAYLAINIVTPSEINGRAVSASDFENGVGDENKVNSAMFLLFDPSGKLMECKDPGLTWPETDETNPLDPAVEKISNVVLILDRAKKWDDCQILALLNYSGEEFWVGADGKIKEDLTLTTTLEKIGDYSVTDTSNEFVMTNSVYNTATGTVTAVPLAGKVSTDIDIAKANPVEIYVERVVAKVTTTAITTDKFVINTEPVNVDGVDKTFTPVIMGIEIANVASTSYLVKNIDGLNFSWDWNDPSNRRSYWANIPSDMVYKNQSWNKIKELSPSNEQSFYIQENTVQDDADTPLDEGLNKTAVLLTAQLKAEDGTAPDLIRFAGSYYSLNGYLTIIANQLKMDYAIKTVDETTGTVSYTSILPEHLETYQEADWDIWQVAPRLTTAAGNRTFVNLKNTDQVVTADAINTLLKDTKFQAWEWKDGMCYYYVYIEHFGTEESVGGSDVPAAKLNGIVRNHVYKLTLTDLKGLGVPVFNPETVIIPDRPVDSNLFYLAARVNILKWRIVSQEVHFE